MLIRGIHDHDILHVVDNLLDEQDQGKLDEDGDGQCHIRTALDEEPKQPIEVTTRSQEGSQEAGRPSIQSQRVLVLWSVRVHPP